MVVNASNRDKIVAWLLRHLPDYAVRMADVTTTTAMIAVQGPEALRVVQPLVDCDLSAMKYYSGGEAGLAGADCFVSRTGYTGEDGCEIICSTDNARDAWARLIAASESAGGVAVGLGARDTLRLEAAMPLYGHELSETINPIQAGLAFAVNFGDRQFVGRESLERAAADPNQPVRVGLQLEGKRVPRQGASVILGSEVVGEVTSGTFSPTFERPIAMAYVRPTAQTVGTKLTVDVRGTQFPAIIVPLPFFDRSKKV
jgi:aminomethyltransferase